MIKPFYFEDDKLFILDQRRLPGVEVWLECVNVEQVIDAIKTLAVRGAPAIGIAAAFGLALAAKKDRADFEGATINLILARPTAVNLAWAVRRVRDKVLSVSDELLHKAVLDEAYLIWEEEKKANDSIADNGAALFETGKKYSILTHCNAGSLATGGIGTALGVIQRLFEQGKIKNVFVDETRPLLQGARLTAYELIKQGIPATLITDNMAGSVMSQGKVDAIITGADRIAANHDTANKIGTYSVAVLAKHHGIPFYIAAPMSTFDPKTPTGHEIEIEERSPNEVRGFGANIWAPEIAVFNPAFDVTPHELIKAIITEKGVVIP